jgi:phosphoenolpyruvate carboxylase
MIPTHGLFYHSHHSSGSLVETNVMQQIPAVSQMTTMIGRPGKIHTVTEYQYHVGSGIQLWTLPSFVVFCCPLYSLQICPKLIGSHCMT